MYAALVPWRKDLKVEEVVEVFVVVAVLDRVRRKGGALVLELAPERDDGAADA